MIMNFNENINMKEMNIDYLAVAPHKGLYAPMGIGMLICEKPIEKTIIEGDGDGIVKIPLLKTLVIKLDRICILL